MVAFDWGIGMFSRIHAAIAIVALGLGSAALAQSASLATFTFNGVQKSISQTTRIDVSTLAGFYQLDPNCAPLCIAPLNAAAGITTIGENEVINFLKTTVSIGDGLLIDSRNPDQRAQGYIAASVNVPLALISADNPYLDDIMKALGARSNGGTLNFTDALPLVIFDDGPSTMDASAFIMALRQIGYPAEKIQYYRGGMLVWTALGLSTEGAKS